MDGHDHYNDLIRSDLAIDRPVLMRLAHQKAARERAACLATGWDRPYRACLGEALSELWSIVRGRRETLRTAHEPSPDQATAIRDAIALLPFRTDYRAAQIQRRDLEAKLVELTQ
jgi:hypothetical protein